MAEEHQKAKEEEAREEQEANADTEPQQEEEASPIPEAEPAVQIERPDPELSDHLKEMACRIVFDTLQGVSEQQAMQEEPEPSATKIEQEEPDAPSSSCNASSLLTSPALSLDSSRSTSAVVG